MTSVGRGDELLVTYTLFDDRLAQSKTERADAAWGDLVSRIHGAPTYIEKNACPLISMCEYGELRSNKNSLRHGANVLRVYGVELDYDAGKVTLAEAKARLQAAALVAVLYTSPSHKPDAPRWRALLPLTEPATPDRREEYVARANRALGGIVTRESFTLSQSFYIGRVRGAEYETAETYGRCIDEALDIEPQFFVGTGSDGSTNRDGTTDAQLREAFNNGADRYQAMLKLSARWAARGMAADDIEANLVELLGASPVNGDGIDLRSRARPMADSAVRKFGETRRPAASHEAAPAWEVPADMPPPPASDTPADPGTAGTITPPARTPIDWRALEGRTPPEREWAMEHWLPMGHTALCAGRGGLGKTLCMQAMASCIATGREYVGEVAKARKVLFWAGEDEEDELWRRQLAICKWLGVSFADLAGHFILESYYARDITLAGLAYGALSPTSMIKELTQQIGDYGAEFVILDSTARVFGGNENDRHQVTTFVSWLANACKVTGAGLCLIGHPGKAEGSEYSGSTAWEGSVRSRLYLSTKLPGGQGGDDDEGGEGEAPDTVRYLSRRKANYASTDFARLNYEAGVLIPDACAPKARRFAGVSPEFGQEIVLRSMRALKAMGFHGTASTRSPDYLPRLAQQYSLLEGLSPKAFGVRMRELLVAQRIKSAPIGIYSNRTPKFGLVEA